MHVACFTGNTAVIRRLVEAGGDLRLHDRKGKTPRDWAMRQGDCKRRRQALGFIDWAWEKALGDSADASRASESTSAKRVVEFPAALRSPFVIYSCFT